MYEYTCTHCGHVHLETGSMNDGLYCPNCHSLAFGQLTRKYLSKEEANNKYGSSG